MSFLARVSSRFASHSRSRALNTSARVLNASPEWEQLVGGKAGIERRRVEFENKYQAAMEAKAKQEGVTVDEFKRRKIVLEAKAKPAQRPIQSQAGASPSPVPAGSDTQGRAGIEPNSQQPSVVRPPPSAAGQTGTSKAAQAFTKKSGQDSPVKVRAVVRSSSPAHTDSRPRSQPLHDIMDLGKVATLPRDQVAQLWTTYHQTKGFLSAAIPTETYQLMISNGKKYPMFVLPLAREVAGALPDGQETESAIEMHLLVSAAVSSRGTPLTPALLQQEWAFLPPPSTVTEPVPSPSTVLFTPLAEYKARQNFSQPYLILTHYTDLSLSHGIVLMRGELTDNVALDQIKAQVLAVRMQLFYNNQVQKEKDSATAMEKERAKLLKAFHEKPEAFDVELLIKAGEISEV